MTAEQLAANGPIYYPSFVQLTPATPTEGSEVVSHWKPYRTGIEYLDVQMAVQHFQEAVTFSRKINAPYFLVCVIKDMRGQKIGTMERAFLNELSSEATAGSGMGPGLVEQEASNLALLYRAELAVVREVETHIRRFLSFANQQRRPGIVSDLLRDWLKAKDGWVLEAVAFSLCAAAMNGSLN